jgi:Lrp/AsnC family transcriptional regulator of ectoine degradation
MRIDERKFLKLIEKNGRITMAKVGQLFGVSQTAARKKLKKFEALGVIKGYYAEIDWSKTWYEEIE